MSLVTRCSSCKTTFKVVADQLRISDGWVRCGHCGEVFDAGMALYEVDAAGGNPQRLEGVPVAAPAVFDAPASVDPPLTGARAPMQAMDWPTPEMLDPSAPPPEPIAPKKARHQDARAIEASPQEPGEAAHAPSVSAIPQLVSPSPIDESVDVQEQTALRRERIQARRGERAARREERKRLEIFAAVTPAPEPSAERPSVSFADPAPSSFGAPADPVHKHPRRWRWFFLCLVALVVLVLQIVRAERDGLAARAPALRPALEWLCSASGCELAALRDIAAITIDGASFSRERNGEGYRLDFTLRSSATVPLAMPAVELSLLDMQERTVVRRVLTPEQFGASAMLPARAEYTTSLPLELSGPEAASLPPVAGYRLIAFYP